MIVSVIGAGYVGLPTALCLAKIGHDVLLFDELDAKIESLKSGQSYLYEEGIDELMKEVISSNAISFYTNADLFKISNSDVIIIAVSTPTSEDGSCDLTNLYSATRAIAGYVSSDACIVIKSTVPVGTGDVVTKLLNDLNVYVDVVSNPEFLREGKAIYDFFNPDRIVIGSSKTDSIKKIKILYSYFEGKSEFVIVSRASAELIKQSANAFLTVKIGFINELSRICEVSKADVREVAVGIGSDKRIGRDFLQPGPGWGGPCFPKDVKAFIKMSQDMGQESKIISASLESNHDQKNFVLKKIVLEANKFRVKKISILGLAFKANTDDMRDSVSIEVINSLLDLGFQVRTYDPRAIKNAKILIGNHDIYCENMIECVEKADMIVILTEWDEFKNICTQAIRDCIGDAPILDFRNILDEIRCKELGLNYKMLGVGRKDTPFID